MTPQLSESDGPFKATKLNLKSKFSIFDSFRDIRVHTYDFLKFMGVKLGVASC